MAAAGTSNPTGQADLRRAASLLSARVGTDVEVAFAATSDPAVADAGRRLRERGTARVAIASYLLADGLFQQRLHAAGADVVLAESPVNPTLDVVDLHRLSTICRSRGATLMVDNTAATPLGQRPLSLGADPVSYTHLTLPTISSV